MMREIKETMKTNDQIPAHMMQSMQDYVDKGTPLGGFLTAVFANDLLQAIGRADDSNLPLLKDYVSWIHWECPASCYGSYEAINYWIVSKREERGE